METLSEAKAELAARCVRVRFSISPSAPPARTRNESGLPHTGSREVAHANLTLEVPSAVYAAFATSTLRYLVPRNLIRGLPTMLRRRMWAFCFFIMMVVVILPEACGGNSSPPHAQNASCTLEWSTELPFKCAQRPNPAIRLTRLRQATEPMDFERKSGSSLNGCHPNRGWFKPGGVQ